MDTATATPAALQKVAALCAKARFNQLGEKPVQNAIEQALQDAGVSYLREYRLSPQDRIDFMVVHHQIGVEVKVQGAPGAVLRQIGRYATHSTVSGLVVATTNHGCVQQIPERVHGKPVHVVVLGRRFM